MPGDDTFYYRHKKEGDLEGMISSHVDDFVLAGTEDFLSEIAKVVEKKFYISKLEDKQLRFTGIDMKSENDTIELCINGK